MDEDVALLHVNLPKVFPIFSEIVNLAGNKGKSEEIARKQL